MEAILTPEVNSPVASARSTTVTERIHYLDNLRAIALLLGILLHAGLGYGMLTLNIWPGANTSGSWYFDYWIWFVHTFRMPLFFLIAGFFAHYLVEKRGLWGFLKNRLLRITLPFIIFWPLLLASMLGVIFYAAANLGTDNGVINLFRAAIENPSQAPAESPPLSTTHLWFLYYLTFFCLIAAFIYRFFSFGAAIYRVATTPWFSLVVMPLATLMVLSHTGIPHPAPERLMPEVWALAFFGAFFFVGWVYFANRHWLDSISPYWPYLLVSSIIATVLLLVNLPDQIPVITSQEQAKEVFALQFTKDHFLRLIATAVLSWHMTALCLIAAKRFLNVKNGLLRYVSDGSYWAYIVHLPIIFYLQMLFNTIDMPLFSEFCIIAAVTCGSCYLSYALLVRRTPIGWLLNGRKRVKASAA